MENLGVKWFSASVRFVKTKKLMLEEFCFTARGRKIHPFDDNNNHVSAAQLRKYPKWKKKKKHIMILKEKYSAIYPGQTLVPDSLKGSLLKMVFGRRQTSGLGQLQHIQALLAALGHLLKPAQGSRRRDTEAKGERE